LAGVLLREPTLITQAVATLDELTGGRAECVISCGNFGLLAQYCIDWSQVRPLSRTIEAHHVIRTLLDEGSITFEGDFFKYAGLFTFARPVQERLPLLIGAMRGPRSFRFAGEISDGVHHALSYTREAYDYVVANVRQGAEKAGRDWQSLDIGAWIVFSVGRDSTVAKEAARSLVGLYASSMPKEQLERNGVTVEDMQPINDALGKGDLAGAIDLTPPEIAERLSVAGTPEECVAKLRSEIVDAGVNHLIFAITDAVLVKALMGRDLENVTSVNDQLQLIHDEVMPAFA
jgi:alkanesulfonate monooxygenase SsuD/methylene tetrahydromethanopterin reductase-like flavin-dependent oxidoreductase (luciferase family)